MTGGRKGEARQPSSCRRNELFYSSMSAIERSVLTAGNTLAHKPRSYRNDVLNGEQTTLIFVSN